MLFVPEIETFIYYLESRSKFHKSHSEKLRQNIIESTLNKFVFNIDYINCLEQKIDENHPLRDDCNLFIKMLIDDDKIGLNADINLNTNDSEIIFEKLSKLYFQDEILIGISEEHENINDESIILNVKNVSSVNKNYIYSKLLTNEVCQIRHTDIENNSDIIPLLNCTYQLHKEFEEVVIIDRQTNLNHNLYNLLIEKGVKFKYYTLNANLTDALIIKNKLKKYHIFNTNNTNLIHERIVIIKNLIITLDEDPFNIEHRNTWLITIQLCSNSTNKILSEKCDKFISTLFRN